MLVSHPCKRDSSPCRSTPIQDQVSYDDVDLRTREEENGEEILYNKELHNL
jgi:hypothetical protein